MLHFHQSLGFLRTKRLEMAIRPCLQVRSRPRNGWILPKKDPEPLPFRAPSAPWRHADGRGIKEIDECGGGHLLIRELNEEHGSLLVLITLLQLGI